MINYYLITKPGIIFGNLLTVAAGFLLASRGNINIALFFQTLLGIAFIIASACVFNNYIDRNVDKNMERTKNRALVKGLITGPKALFFGTILGIVGGLILYVYTNNLTLLIAAIGFFVYVVLYSFWKGHTIYGTAIGSIAGAVPPVMGYTAVSNQFDLGAMILFAILILWQMPHFMAIAIYHLKDYTKAGIPVLPVEKGIFRTKIHMIIYIIAFIPVSLLLTYFGYTGYIYLSVVSIIGLSWLALSILGFKSKDDDRWGKQMFQLSLVLITAFCLIIPYDVL